MQTATLSNGARVVLAERKNVPLVEMNFQFNFGYAQENIDQLGYTNFMMDMLNEGTKKYTSLEFDEILDSMGSNIGFGSDLDTSFVSLSSLKSNLGKTLDLTKEAIMYPSFPESEIARIKKQTLAAFKRDEFRPSSIAFRNIGNLLYGADHPYGKLLIGSGVTSTIENIDAKKLSSLHKLALNPKHLTFTVAGDISLDEMVNLLEMKFGDWESASDTELKVIPNVSLLSLIHI